jgi:hypothetical protein
MPHLIDRFLGLQAQKVCQRASPFGPGLPADLAAQVELLEIWGSGVTEPGGDYCEFRLIDATGKLLGKRRIEGY